LLLALALLAGCGPGDEGAGNPESNLSESEATEPLKDAPPALAAIRAQAGELLGGGTDAFEARLEQLRGTAVVVNKWASWCGPCRLEFPHFQSQAQKLGGGIAFLGVDANDSDDAARTFLEQLPLPYPSYTDPDEDIGRSLKTPQLYPVTLFVDERGKTAFMHIGEYRAVGDLTADIDRYLGGAGA